MRVHEWFGSGPSKVIRDVMLFFIGLDLLGMLIRNLGSKTYSERLSMICFWLFIYGVAYLFRRRAP